MARCAACGGPATAVSCGIGCCRRCSGVMLAAAAKAGGHIGQDGAEFCLSASGSLIFTRQLSLSPRRPVPAAPAPRRVAGGKHATKLSRSPTLYQPPLTPEENRKVNLVLEKTLLRLDAEAAGVDPAKFSSPPPLNPRLFDTGAGDARADPPSPP